MSNWHLPLVQSVTYQAASPDEAALVAAAKCLGFIFCSRSPKAIEVSIGGRNVEYQVSGLFSQCNDEFAHESDL